jgi:hypothetical protein
VRLRCLGRGVAMMSGNCLAKMAGEYCSVTKINLGWMWLGGLGNIVTKMAWEGCP